MKSSKIYGIRRLIIRENLMSNQRFCLDHHISYVEICFVFCVLFIMRCAIGGVLISNRRFCRSVSFLYILLLSVVTVGLG